MKQSQILPALVVPALLLSSAGLVGLAIHGNWNFEISSYLIFVVTAVYLSVFERLNPLKSDWKIKKQGLMADLKHVIFSAGLFDALGKMAALSLVLFIHEQLFQALAIWDQLPFLLVFVLANIIGEFLPYVYHRLSHVGKENSRLSLFLWKTHSIHHLPVTLNWLKTSWIHPVNMFMNTALKMIPLLLLGFSADVLFAVGVMHIVVAYVSHANLKTSRSFLDYLIVTPQVHHFHHSTLLHEAKNFGNIIPFWDLVFGTYYNRKGRVEEVGVVESGLTYPKKENYLKQLSFPFIRLFRGCCA